MSLPTVILTGNLTDDPVLRHTQNGTAVVSLRVACNSARKDEAGNWIDGDSTFIDVTSWRSPEAINANLHKGSRVNVIGQLEQRTYETQAGEKRTAYEVRASSVAAVVSGPRPAAAEPFTDEAPW